MSYRYDRTKTATFDEDFWGPKQHSPVPSREQDFEKALGKIEDMCDSIRALLKREGGFYEALKAGDGPKIRKALEDIQATARVLERQQLKGV